MLFNDELRMQKSINVDDGFLKASRRTVVRSVGIHVTET